MQLNSIVKFANKPIFPEQDMKEVGFVYNCLKIGSLKLLMGGAEVIVKACWKL